MHCLVALAIFGLSQIPTGFIPIEDQGYLMMNVQLPDGATFGTNGSPVNDLSDQVSKIDGIENVIAIDGISLLDNSASLANAGVLYVMFKDWSVRGKKEDLLAFIKNSMTLRKNPECQSFGDGSTCHSRFGNFWWFSNAA